MNNTSSEAPQSKNPLSVLQKVRPDLLGFVFQLSWLYLVLYDNALTEGAHHASSATALYLCSVIPLIVTLAIGLRAPHKFQTLAENRLGVYGAPTITTLGTIFYCANFIYDSLPLIILGGILTGIGSAVLAVRWATAFGRASTREILENFPLLLAIVFVICVSCLYMPIALRGILVVFLPILSGALLQYAKRYAGASTYPKEWSQAKSVAPIPTWIKGHSVAFLCVTLVGLIGFNTGLLAFFEVESVNYAAIFYIATAVLILGFAGTLLFQMSRSSMILLFGLPLLIILLTLLPFAQFLVNSPADALPSIGNIALELMLLTGCVLFALATDRAVGKTFMSGRITMAIFDLLGSLAGYQLLTLGDSQWTLQIATVCLLLSVELLLIGLIAGYFIIQRIQKGRQDTAEVSQPLEASSQHLTICEETGMGDAIPSQSPDETVTDEVLDSTPTKKSDSLDERIEKIAAAYGLSAREREVFTLLAKGRSSSRIQEDLCIAAGTVNYHTRNIYAKLGVHNRQQIIDLLEKK